MLFMSIIGAEGLGIPLLPPPKIPPSPPVSQYDSHRNTSIVCGDLTHLTKAPPMTFLNTSIPVKFFCDISVHPFIHSFSQPSRQTGRVGLHYKKTTMCWGHMTRRSGSLVFLTVGCTDRQGERGAAGGCDCWLHIDSIYAIDSHNIVH